MSKKFFTLVMVATLVAGSIFAFGPYGRTPQAAPAQGYGRAYGYGYKMQAPADQMPCVTGQPLYGNLPEGAELGDEVTVSGTIEAIKIVPGEGTEIVVSAGDESYEVHTGPIWMYEGLEIGAQIEVQGWTVTADDESWIVPKTVVINGVEIQLRDDEGFPVWMKGPAGSRGPIGGGFQRLPRRPGMGRRSW
ncbi:MAG: hypothetical protein PWP37_1256 [Thermotogota bacterium]|nr:hypothetical protein [Thermotogota bacterium]MDK2865064.1 hypothetical protein [Thermotogota bacterium]HCZ06598.1 hypothetical protein [Thermotogota bacterium]